MDKLFSNTPACESEHVLKVIGELPDWLNGNLFRLGPGLFDLDEDFCVNHWFDGAAILFRYSFKANNQVSARSVYLKTDAYQKMITVRRPVYTEFGTQAYPDTSKSIFSRFINRVAPSELTDNVHGNIYSIGNDLYCASETCNIWRINPETLEAENKVDLSKVLSVHLASSHPHTEPDGTVINLGSSFLTGLKYHLFKIYPNCKNPEEINNNSNTPNALTTKPTTSYNRKRKDDKAKCNFPPTKQIATLSSSWTTMFSYNHSFSVTKNYIIVIEQPMLINMLKLVAVVIKQNPLREAFEWVGDQEKNRFHVIEKESGRILPYSFYAPAFFFLHTINAYEEDNHIVIDLVGYDNERVLDTFYLERLRRAQTVESICTPTIRRYVLPIVDIEKILKDKNRKRLHDNLTTLPYTKSRSEKIDENGISVTADILLNPGFEIPSINRNYDARDYEFVYGSGLFERNEFSNSVYDQYLTIVIIK
ncbi:beta,beta-carotene 15,15'-dioxygenase-like isoform X2 [Panonychus citri]|uniref:beta,beta-carotene 15,15'-dioxygenase-like isoform X2 n=1 Tax=Panonychus citri TaxID=50023 RepID=UPI0023075E72|nr:beta,beta-carotene 15,15'-dioxygenase-like isoform X2 [Panonychus citri]